MVAREFCCTFGADNTHKTNKLHNMKKFTLFLTGLLLALTAQAAINIESGKSYTFTCYNWNYGTQGYMVLGAYHEAAPYVYYDISLTEPSEDAYWTLTADNSGKGYTIRNAKSGQYLVYKEGRPQNGNGEYMAKGIQLADAVTDNTGLWTFAENMDGLVYITNVADTEQFFNVRTDGSFLVGTYNSHQTANGFFIICDSEGNSIVKEDGGESGGGDGGETTPDKPVTGDMSGIENGEYWERTGLDQPVVFTTNTANPVLYSIRNVRSGLYATATSYELMQSNTNSTKFYFVQADGGINIYTSEGLYVSTYYMQNNQPLDLSYATPKGEIWTFGYATTGVGENIGYTICKADNLPDNSGSNNGWWGNYQSSYLYWNDYNDTSICLYDVDAGSTFIFSSSDERHIEHLVSNGITFDGMVTTGIKNYATDIRINGKEITYDKGEKAYYCALPETVRNGADFVTKMSAEMLQTDGDYELRINGMAAASDSSITIPAVSCATPYTLSVVKDGTETMAEAPLHFTFLPIVEMSVYGDNGSYYVTGSLRVTDPNIAGYDSTVIAAYKWRGATAMGKSKKSYAIKLRDENGNSVDREYFGLRNDNNWILDAMAIDMAGMRNRVSTDLWNNFATKPYHQREGWEKKARTGTRGEFVEVFLNGYYHGLYCMTEKMDRKQLKLKKYVPATETSTDTIHGTLYKSSQWSYEVLMGHDQGSRTFPKTAPQSYNNEKRSETWANYEIKYPDWEEEPIDWGPLWNAINFVATSTDTQFDDGIYSWFDMPVVLDYYLFIELMLATDNHGKNLFFFNYDQKAKKHTKKIGIAPWDLDGTWGRRWDGSRSVTAADQNFDDFLWENEHGTHTIFYRMQNSKYWSWASDLATRYAELRPTYFSKESLTARFRSYLELFSESNAVEREAARWPQYHPKIAEDVDYIAEWISDRIDYLDNQYGYEPIVDGIQMPVTDERFVSVSGGHGCITLHTTHPTTVKVYTVGGALAKTIELNRPKTTVDGFMPGVYIVNNQKVLVK